MSATANGSTFSIDYKGSKDDIPKYNATQAAKVRNSKTDAYADINDGAWPATLALKGTYLYNNSTAVRSDITSKTSTDDAINRVYGAVRSGKVTHTYDNLSEDYHFEGWGTADAPTSADASYEYNITENTTVYAFFTKKYPVNFSADANGSVTATVDKQALISGNKVVGGTEVTLKATANPGYEFIGWSNGETTNPYTFTATENITLTANFEKILIEIGDGDNSEVLNTYKDQTVDVKVNRTFKANDGYYTICLPFDLPASKIGTAYQVTDITEHVADQGFYMVFDEVQNLEAGQPYLILPNDLTTPTFEDVTITYTDNGKSVAASGAGINFKMVGVINGGGQTEVGQYWVGDNGYFYNGDGTGTTAKLGLRVLFNITDNAGTPVKIRARVVLGENAATSLDNITNGENTTIKVIENGQLIIIRDGEKFNAQGVRF